LRNETRDKVEKIFAKYRETTSQTQLKESVFQDVSLLG